MTVPDPLDDLMLAVQDALDSSAVEVEVWETDAAGKPTGTALDPLRRLTSCLRSAGLLDEGRRT